MKLEATSIWFGIIALFGGLGLFLFGMFLMSEGLQLAAGERLRALYARPPPGSGEPLEVLLAWTVAESGDARHAAALAATNVIPDTAGAHLFLSLSFPRILFLRGDYKLFLQYSGDLPTIFGEEARARAALAGR